MNYMKKILQSFSDNLMQLNLKTNLNFDENLIKSSNEIYDNNLLQIPIISYSLDENNVENNILEDFNIQTKFDFSFPQVRSHLIDLFNNNSLITSRFSDKFSTFKRNLNTLI